MNLKTILMSVAGASVIAAPVMAQVYTKTGSVGGGISAVTTYGVLFQPAVNVSVTDLGAFAYRGYSSGSMNVAIWKSGDATPVAQVTLTFNSGDGDIGQTGWRYYFANADQSLGFSPVTLSAGVEYALVETPSGTQYRASSSNVSQDSTNLQFNHLFNPGPSFTAGNNPYTGSFTSYSTPEASVTMIISPVAVPEPSAYAAVAGLGLVGFAALRKFRR